MTILYLWDEENIYVGEREHVQYQPVPANSTLKAPPEISGTEVAYWNGSDWEVLPDRPIPPEPDPEPDPEPIPEEVEGWQAEVAMRLTPVDPEDPESQNVWDRVQDIIAAMPDGPEKVTAQIVLQRGKIRLDSQMLVQIAPLVPLSQERVVDMFRLAAGIVA